MPSPSPRGLLTELCFFSLFPLSLSPPLPLEKLFSLPNLQTRLHHHDINEDNLQYGRSYHASNPTTKTPPINLPSTSPSILSVVFTTHHHQCIYFELASSIIHSRHQIVVETSLRFILCRELVRCQQIFLCRIWLCGILFCKQDWNFFCLFSCCQDVRVALSSVARKS